MNNFSKKENFNKRRKASKSSQKTHLNPEITLEEYKRQIRDRLFKITPTLQKVAMGDFSENVTIPEKEDEFTELFASLNLMIDDLRELTEIQKRAKEEVEEKVRERTKELEKSRRALINMLEDVEVTRNRAEEERDKTKAIITNFTDGLIVLDRTNKITLINSEGEKLLNVKTREVEGKILGIFTKKPSLQKLAELIKAKKTGKGLFREELFFEKPKERVLEITTISLTYREESVIILHDISREKLVEKMKTEFVSLAAHQLRTPLSAIKWTLRMLLDGDIGTITKEQRNFIEKTYQSNERMIGLINDLLDVTRIEEGRYLYKPVLTNLENVVQFVINSYQEEIKRRKLKLEFKKPKTGLPRVSIDVEKMKLAIQNILDNAVRYTPAGGLVTITLKRVKKEIETSIEDTGIGVPRDQQERVFTKFFRAANIMRMDTEGSGLGLFIAKNIIESHGGKIWFDSKEGKGTTFYFTIPAKEEFTEFLKKF